jgi:hypothetical protein
LFDVRPPDKFSANLTLPPAPAIEPGFGPVYGHFHAQTGPITPQSMTRDASCGTAGASLRYLNERFEPYARPERHIAVTLEDAMNWSMYTADRTTHLKIVVVGLTAALLIAVIGISATELNLGTDIMSAQGPTVYKAGAPVAFTARDGVAIR